MSNWGLVLGSLLEIRSIRLIRNLIMKYSPKQYAQAFSELLKNEKGDKLRALAKKCAEELFKNNAGGMWPEIEKEIENIADREGGVKRILIETTEAPSGETLKKYFEKGTKISLVKNPEVLGGIKAEMGDVRVDDTIQMRLNKLRKTLTEN